MKKSMVTLAILLISIIVYGQPGASAISEIEQKINRFDYSHMKFAQDYQFQKSKSLYYKSSQESRQGMDSLVFQVWDENVGEWIKDIIIAYTYDINGNLILELFSYWETMSGQWITDWKTEYEYNIAGKLIQKTDFYFDHDTEEWIPEEKVEDTVDINGLVTKRLMYTWDENTSQWISDTKTEFYYDENDKLTMTLEYEWDRWISQWIEDWKTEFAYNANDKLIEKIDYTWDTGTSEWTKTWKGEFSYEPGGNLIRELYYDWDQIVELWIPELKYEFSYAGNDVFENVIEYEWDIDGSQWLFNEKAEFSYNTDYTFQELVLPVEIFFYDQSIFNYMLLGVVHYEWDETSGEWNHFAKTNFYYSEHQVGGINEQNAEILQLFPNPFTTSTTFKYTLEKPSTVTIRIFNSQGQLIDNIEQEQPHGKHQYQWNAEGLPAGMYYFRIQVGEMVSGGKIVLIR